MGNEYIQCSPRITVYLGGGRSRVEPLFLFREDERPDRTGTNTRLFDVDIHHQRCTWTPICRGMCETCRPCRFGWRGPGFCTDANTLFYIGTERMTTNSLVPFRSFYCFPGEVKTHPYTRTTKLRPISIFNFFLPSSARV